MNIKPSPTPPVNVKKQHQTIQVSFVIPVRNGENTLSLCLDSILAQKTKCKFEIIIVDDGSTDQTARLAKKYSKKSVRLIRSRQSRGPGAARNRGLSAASGTFVAFCDVDVELTPNWLETVLREFAHPWIDCVQGEIRPKQSSNSEFMSRFRASYIGKKTNQTFTYLDQAKTGLPLVNSSCFIARRQSLLARGLSFCETLPRCEDADFSYRMIFSGCNFAFAPNAKAWVSDDRTPTGYLLRSLVSGYFTNEVRQNWVGKPTLPPVKKIVQSMRELNPHSPVDLFVGLNQAVGLAAELASFGRRKFRRRKSFENSHENSLVDQFRRPDPRNSFFVNRKKKTLGPFVRMTWLEKTVALVDVQSFQHDLVPMKEASVLKKWMINGNAKTAPAAKGAGNQLEKRLLARNFLVLT